MRYMQLVCHSLVYICKLPSSQVLLDYDCNIVQINPDVEAATLSFAVTYSLGTELLIANHLFFLLVLCYGCVL